MIIINIITVIIRLYIYIHRERGKNNKYFIKKKKYENERESEKASNSPDCIIQFRVTVMKKHIVPG